MRNKISRFKKIIIPGRKREKRKMSLPTMKNDFAFELAPHQLSNSLYNAQGSCSPYPIPPNTTPIVFDSTYYPTVDCQARSFYEAPRTVTGASGSMGIFGAYRQTQSLGKLTLFFYPQFLR